MMDEVARRRIARQVQRGEYVVDAEAVAAAMLRRWAAEQSGSAVLVPAQALDRATVGAQELESGPPEDLA